MSTTTPAWNELKEKGGLLPLMLVFWLYKICGRWLIQLMLYVVVLWYWVLSARARAASLQYLRYVHAFSNQTC
ncbi:MAG: acyltransferase, partial [Acinetobacter sp.]